MNGIAGSIVRRLRCSNCDEARAGSPYGDLRPGYGTVRKESWLLALVDGSLILRCRFLVVKAAPGTAENALVRRDNLDRNR